MDEIHNLIERVRLRAKSLPVDDLGRQRALIIQGCDHIQHWAKEIEDLLSEGKSSKKLSSDNLPDTTPC